MPFAETGGGGGAGVPLGPIGGIVFGLGQIGQRDSPTRGERSWEAVRFLQPDAKGEVPEWFLLDLAAKFGTSVWSILKRAPGVSIRPGSATINSAKVLPALPQTTPPTFPGQPPPQPGSYPGQSYLDPALALVQLLCLTGAIPAQWCGFYFGGGDRRDPYAAAAPGGAYGDGYPFYALEAGGAPPPGAGGLPEIPGPFAPGYFFDCAPACRGCGCCCDDDEED